MPVLEANKVRLALDKSSKLRLLDAATAERIEIPQGAGIDIECAVFDGPVAEENLITVFDDVTSVQLIIRAVSPNGAMLLEQTINDDEIDSDIFFSDWEDEADQQFTFSFSAEETAVVLPTSGTLPIYFVVRAITPTNEYNLGFGYGEIVDIGIVSVVPPVALPFSAVYVDADGDVQNDGPINYAAGQLLVDGVEVGPPDLDLYVPSTRTINTFPLSDDIILTTANIADSLNKRYVTNAQLAVLTATSGANTGDQDLSGLVPKTTTVNGHALSGNVNVTLADVGAQAANANLTALAGLSTLADRLAYWTGAGTAALTTFSSFARSLLDDADDVAMRATLQLGTAALANTGTSSGNVPLLDGTGKIPTSLLPSSVLGDVQYQGVWNANTNSPTIPAASSGNKGQYYVVSVAGSTSIDGETDWKIGDWLVSNGTTWNKIDNTDLVTSVAGRVGAIVLAAADISGLATSATTDTTNANNISSGTLAVARGGTGITSFGAGVATWLGTPSGANLASALTSTLSGSTIAGGTFGAVNGSALTNLPTQVSDAVYDESAWDGVTNIAPSKNAVRDKIETVVASIPTAPSNGVIGTAVLAITSDTVTVTYANGVLTETTGATYAWTDASSRLTVDFVTPLSDAFYNWMATTGVDNLVSPRTQVIDETQLRIVFKDVAGAVIPPPFEIRLSIIR